MDITFFILLVILLIMVLNFFLQYLIYKEWTDVKEITEKKLWL